MTAEQVTQLERVLDLDISYHTLDIQDIKCQFDLDTPFSEQVISMIDNADFTSNEWQGCKILVNLPALSTAAALVLAELHGRMGYYPPVIRLKRSDSVPPVWNLAEIMNLDAQRQDARKRR